MLAVGRKKDPDVFQAKETGGGHHLRRSNCLSPVSSNCVVKN